MAVKGMLKEKKQDLTCLALTQKVGERHVKREKARFVNW